ncbi:MAG: hypothetical protein RSE13_02865 [Planktothrix sp. GU0601_MAG3]|nr:MAG: hypothetical protein RSE13_02865 [Planktothrix sp. GU0601_MAG3]
MLNCYEEKKYRNRIDPTLLELSKVSKDFNIVREWATVDSEEKEKIQLLLELDTG